MSSSTIDYKNVNSGYTFTHQTIRISHVMIDIKNSNIVLQ